MGTSPDLVVITWCCSWMRWRSAAAAGKGSRFPRRRLAGGGRWRCGRLVALSLVRVLSRGGCCRITEGRETRAEDEGKCNKGTGLSSAVGGGGGGSGGGLSPFSALRDESPAGLHLNVQASLHGAHLHVLVQVSVHVALRCGQLHLRSGRLAVTHTREKHRHATPAAAVLVPCSAPMR